MIPPVMVPVTYKEISLALVRSLNNRKDAIQDLEHKITEYINCKHSIATSSGRTAIYILLKAYGIKEGDKVAMPAYMCSSVSDLLFNMNIKVNFIDIDKDTYNIDVYDLNEKMSKDTKAIIAVHMFGNPCEIDSINEIAKDNNAILIEDAAQAIGAKYKKEQVGAIGDAGFFSFGRGKPLTSIDGGAIVTNNSEIARKCQTINENFLKQSKMHQLKLFLNLNGYSQLRNRAVYRVMHSLVRNDTTRFNINIDNVETKYTYFQANLANIQLSRLDEFNNIRKKNSSIICNALKTNSHIKLLNVSPYTDPIFLRYPIRVDASIRDKLMEQFYDEGIETSVVYPISLSKIYSNSLECKNAEEIVKETIALPVHPQVTKKDLENMIQICNTV